LPSKKRNGRKPVKEITGRPKSEEMISKKCAGNTNYRGGGNFPSRGSFAKIEVQGPP